jgi:hypothetical protein
VRGPTWPPTTRAREWDLIVIGPGRRYDLAVTHDRELVIRAAEPLLRRLVPEH